MEEEEAAPAKAETPAKAPVASPKKEVASPKKEVASPKKEVTKEGETPKAEDATKEGETPKAEGDAKPGEGKRGQKRRREDEPFEIREDEPEIPDDYMCFDWNNSDLTFKINKETFASAEPFHVAAWGFVFSSARATHGFTSGKIAFEAKWTGNLEVKLEDVKEPHEMRVGWSTDCSNLQVKKIDILKYKIKTKLINHLSRSAHPTPNFTKPEFQFPQFKVLQSGFWVHFDISLKLFHLEKILKK